MINKVIFFQIKLEHTKLLRIIQKAHMHFANKEQLTIVVPDQKALEFVDLLLWKTPKDSFLPHDIEKNSQELIQIVLEKDMRIPPYIFNLTAHALQLKHHPKIIYEFDDSTSPQKSLNTRNKYQHYKNLGLNIELH